MGSDFQGMGNNRVENNYKREGNEDKRPLHSGQGAWYRKWHTARVKRDKWGQGIVTKPKKRLQQHRRNRARLLSPLYFPFLLQYLLHSQSNGVKPKSGYTHATFTAIHFSSSLVMFCRFHSVRFATKTPGLKEQVLAFMDSFRTVSFL